MNQAIKREGWTRSRSESWSKPWSMSWSMSRSGSRSRSGSWSGSCNFGEGMKYLIILLLMASCGSDKDAYTYETEQVDDMPRTGHLNCGQQMHNLICGNETITIRTNLRSMKAYYEIRTDK